MIEVEPLGPGPLPLAGSTVEIVTALGRVGDGLVYGAQAEGRPVRLREYAPCGIVRRRADGRLEAADPAQAAAWDAAAAGFLDAHSRLIGLDHYAITPVFRAAAREGARASDGGYAIGAPVGETLAAALARGLVLPPGEVMRLAADLADALAMLHARGILHLDIAPATVSIAGGWLELADFAIDNRPFMSLLGSEEGLTRPGYSPIELSDAAMADPLGPAADIYAASALLFRLVAGREPPPWQARWRDPSATALSDNPYYPSAFLSAIDRGMAIEPADRLLNGTAWRDALGLPPVNQALHGTLTRRPAAPPLPPLPPPPLPGQPGPVRARSWLLPVLASVALLALAVIVYLAVTQRWFAPKPKNEASVPANGTAPARPEPAAPPAPAPAPPPANEVPVVQIGGAAAGRLEEGDRRRGEGEYEDRYAVNGRGGERVVIRLSSSEFDPILSIAGPDVSEANDDADDDTRDSEIIVTLPVAGRYTIAVSSYERGETGAYTLTVEAAEAAPSEPAN
jgi:hypothetical protein